MKQLWKALALVVRCDRGSFWRRVVYVFLQSLLPLVNLYVLKLLVDSVSDSVLSGTPPTSHLSPIICLAVMCAVFLLGRVISALNSVNNDVLGQRLIDYMSDIMQRQAAEVDLASFDSPEYHDIFHRAQLESTQRPIQIMDSFMTLFGSLLSIAGVMVMLLSASWWVVVVMVVAVLPGFAVRLYKARSIYDFRRSNTQLYRRTAYYGSLLTSREAAKEMRAFGLAPHFRRLFVEVRHRLSSRLLAISRRLGTLDVLSAVVEMLAMFVVVWLLVRQAFAGAITIGSFVMLFEAFRRGQGYLTALVGAIAKLYDNRLFVSNLFEFLNLRPSILTPAEPVPVPERVDSVEFRDITFRYPGMERDVLSHYSLTARRGELCRIEGRNGYGKSTLVKLLLRLYDPDGGAVLVNGIDIRRFDLRQWRSHVGVVFQDFVRYACTVEENLSFGNSSPLSTLHSPLISDILDRLPHGGKTLLGRVFDGGEELSMGQWQRLAIARMILTDAPVMVMDEPMAWLDNQSRETFIAELNRLLPSKVVIIISHQ